MRYPTWKNFEAKYSENPQGAFESLCRMLFRRRYGIEESLPYYYNNAGNETVPIEKGSEIVGFQAKYFSGETLDDSHTRQIKHSIERAHAHYPKQNKIIVYTNLLFGNPPEGKEKTARQKDVEDTAKANSMIIEWIMDANILDVVAQDELIYNLFFDLEVDLIHLDEYIKNANLLYSKTIKDSINYGGKELTIEREDIKSQLEGLLIQEKHVILQGEGGCGKSAVIKSYINHHPEVPVIWLSASQFDTDDVNTLFHLEKTFSLGQVRQYYADITKKIVVIDSAEKLLDLRNKMPLTLFIGSMQQDRWQMVFTARKSSVGRLSKLLTTSLELNTISVDVPLLSDESLENFLAGNSLAKPQDNNLYSRIHNLFYLARYTEVVAGSNLTLDAFRNRVWETKIRGEANYSFSQQEKREQCLLEMARRKLSTEGFYIKKADLDTDAIAALMLDDIVCYDNRKGYYFAHDIYQEWALDYQVSAIWEEKKDVEAFTQALGESLSSVNAFKRWYGKLIDEDSECAPLFINAVFNGTLTGEKWLTAVFAEILRSKTFANTFFNNYQEALTANDFQWGKYLLKILPVNCKEILTYVTYQGAQYPVMRPIGSGWNCVVDFIYTYHDVLATQEGRAINTILTDYPWIQNGDKQTLHKAGLLALQPHVEVAEIRKKGDDCFFEKKESACKLTAQYFSYIPAEIKNILDEVIINKWVSHLDPYYELCSFIVKAEGDTGLPLYILYPQEVLALMDLFWCEQEEDKKDEPWGNRSSHIDSEEAWGLSDRRLMLTYFPASGLQTCIGSMLVFHPQITLDFIIQFVDKCVNQYAKARWHGDIVEPLDLILPDGATVTKLGNQTLWNLYRGTSGMSAPHLLESIHMALEGYLLQSVKEKRTDEVKKYLQEIITHSQSLSLLSIVASLVVAYPDEFFDEAIIMTSNLQLLKYDLTRYTSEVHSGMIEFAFHGNQNMLTERKNSNALKHRKQHLETLLFNIQATYIGATNTEGQERLERAYKNVDSLKEQLELEPEDVKPLTKFIISRCDIRSMKQEAVDFNGAKGTLFTPHLDEEQKVMSDDTVKNSNAMMAGSLLRMWATYRAKGEFEKIKGNQYEDNPLKSLDVCRDILKQLETREGGLFLLPGDEFVPSTVCSVLIRDFEDQLTANDFDYCVGIVVNALEDVNHMVGNSLSEYDICLQVVGIIMNRRPQYVDRCKHILYIYASISQEVAGKRACDVVAEVIANQKLWDKHEAVMYALVWEYIENKAKSGEIEALLYEDAESLLCLLSVYPKSEKLKHIADVSLERVSHIWDLNDKRKNLYIGQRHSSSYMVARILLSASNEEIPRLLTYFTRYLNTDVHDTLLMSFIYRTLITNDYDRFWIVWYALYDTIIHQRDNHFHSEMLNNYMFNPVQFSHWGDDWFRIEEKDMDFFRRIAVDLGHLPIVLRNITHVSRTLAKNYFMDSLEIFNVIIENNPSFALKDYSQDTMTNLEAILRRELPNLNDKIKTDDILRKRLITVLDFMMTNGSSYASMIKSGLS